MNVILFENQDVYLNCLYKFKKKQKIIHKMKRKKETTF